MTTDVVAKFTFHKAAFFFLPLVTTIFLHAALGFFLTANWTSMSDRDEQIIKNPNVINAHLVNIENRNIDKNSSKKMNKMKSRPIRSTQSKEKISPEATVKSVASKQKKEVESKKNDNREVNLTDYRLDDLMELIALEDRALEAEDEKDLSVSYALLIQRKIISYWSRPPSARNGMECVLLIRLIPTGEVVTANVLRGSGNKSFDLSAINAVKKAAVFPELRDLSSRDFERHFRQFRLLFRPEDLRY